MKKLFNKNRNHYNYTKPLRNYKLTKRYVKAMRACVRHQ